MRATLTDVGAPAAPCAGKWELFESRDLADHRAAAALCASCPIVVDCAARLALCSSSAGESWAGGTWAGDVVGGLTTADERLEGIYSTAEARAAWRACRAGDRGAWAVEGYRIYVRRYPRSATVDDHDDLTDSTAQAVAS